MTEQERTKSEIYMRYPGFKAKAMTLSYDDGVVQDERLIKIMNENGLKGTFNINSALFDFGKRRLSKNDAIKLYLENKMEVAMHGENHYFATATPNGVMMREFLFDKLNLEQDFGCIVRGMAYANGRYNDDIKTTLKLLGVCYARAVCSTKSFGLPTDWLELQPTVRHADPELMEILERFIKLSPDKSYVKNPVLFYLWGHSYEFDDADNWFVIENFAKRVSECDDIYHATNIEIYDYVKAFDSLIYSADGSIVYNPTATDVYVRVGYADGKNVLIKAGETKKI
jgi:peptidoglycan/xylan/chitin deacetylase (PgdA/CDA1 family)